MKGGSCVVTPHEIPQLVTLRGIELYFRSRCHPNDESQSPRLRPRILQSTTSACIAVCKSGDLTAEFLQRNHRVVELLVVVHDDLLVVTFADNQTSVTPAEVIHAPEGVNWQEETVHRIPKARY